MFTKKNLKYFLAGAGFGLLVIAILFSLSKQELNPLILKLLFPFTFPSTLFEYFIHPLFCKSNGGNLCIYVVPVEIADWTERIMFILTTILLWGFIFLFFGKRVVEFYHSRKDMKKILLSALCGVLLGSLSMYSLMDAQATMKKEQLEKEYTSDLYNKNGTIYYNEDKITRYEKEKSDLAQANAKLKKEKLELLKIVQPDLLRFSNDTLGFSLWYPKWFGALDFSFHNGETGKGFVGSFENIALSFGGVSKDFSEGRETGPLDYSGGSISQEMKKQRIRVLSIEGGQIDVLRGEGEPAPGNWFPEGTLGALVKLRGKKYQGLAFYAHESEVTLDEFETVLKTLVIR